MATVTLHPDPQKFPIGTTVKVYEEPQPNRAGWSGSGAALSEPTVTAGSGGASSVLTVTGVTAGKRYVAQAEVSGVLQVLGFSGGETASGGGVTSINGKEGAVTLVAEDVEAVGLASPHFTGTPTAPTAAGGTNTTQVGTTAFAHGEAATAQTAAEAAAATAAAAKDATLKTEAETKDATAKAAAEAASRPAATPIVTRHRETVSIPGTPEAQTIPMGAVSLASGETQKAVKISYRVREGTTPIIKFKLQKNGVDITGFTGLEATEATIQTKTPTAVALEEGDRITLVIESVSGTGVKGFAATLHVDHSV